MNKPPMSCLICVCALLFLKVPNILAQTESRTDRFPVRLDREIVVGLNRDSPTSTRAMDSIRRDLVAQAIQANAQFLVSGEKGTWSPDGTEIAFGRMPYGNGIMKLDIKSGRLIQIVDCGKDPAWSPDGNWIAFIVGHGLEEEVWVVPVESGKPRKIADGAFPTWSADSRQVYFRHLKPFSFKSVPVEGGVKPITIATGSGRSWYATVAPNGRQIADLRISDSAVIVENLDTGRKTPYFSAHRWRGVFTNWSGDSRLLAFGAFTKQTSGSWLLNLNTSELQRILDSPFTMPQLNRAGDMLTVDMRHQLHSGLRFIWADVWMMPVENVGRQSSASATPKADTPISFKPGDLVLSTKPSMLQTNRSIRGEVGRGELLEIKDINNQWCLTEYSGGKGWVDSANLLRTEQAINELGQVIDARPLDAYAYWMRGRAREAIGKHEDAVDDYHASLQIVSFPEIFIKCVELLFELGQYESSMQSFDGALVAIGKMQNNNLTTSLHDHAKNGKKRCRAALSAITHRSRRIRSTIGHK